MLRFSLVLFGALIWIAGASCQPGTSETVAGISCPRANDDPKKTYVCNCQTCNKRTGCQYSQTCTNDKNSCEQLSAIFITGGTNCS